MRIFDSHCHLDDNAYARDLDAVVQRARDADVFGMMVVGLGLESCRQALNLAERHKGICVSVGIHPHDANNCDESILAGLVELSGNPLIKAWGETGLDFNRMYSPRLDQERWFIRQIALSAGLDLPMIFHERDSKGRFLEIMRGHWIKDRRGVVHCFSGSDEELDAYLELGLYIGITGILTIKGRGHDLRRQVKRIPLNRIVVETDAPYLTPAPQRNKFRRNEPAFVRSVLIQLSEILCQDIEEMAAATWTNACTLFGLQG